MSPVASYVTNQWPEIRLSAWVSDSQDSFLPVRSTGRGLWGSGSAGEFSFIYSVWRDAVTFPLGCEGWITEELATRPRGTLRGLGPADTCHLGFQGAKCPTHIRLMHLCLNAVLPGPLASFRAGNRMSPSSPVKSACAWLILGPVQKLRRAGSWGRQTRRRLLQIFTSCLLAQV